MRIRILILMILLLGIQFCMGQNMQKYSSYVAEADSLYGIQDYKGASDKFKEAFDQLDGKAYSPDRFKAACAYAMAKNVERAFYHLFYLAENPQIKYNDLEQVSNEKDLSGLHKEKDWTRLIDIVKVNKQEYEKDLDKPLVAILDSIHQTDQGVRQEIEKIEKEYGRTSKEMQAHWKLMHEIDSLNLIKVRKILDERGWLGANVVGEQGNTTLFLVIQHSDLETQVTYLPMMREAVKSGNARGSSLALLEDRIAMRQGKKQIYGSQIMVDPQSGEHYVSPILEPEKVNERRASVGLGPIEDYVSIWGITWNVEKHKERTMQMELEKKE